TSSIGPAAIGTLRMVTAFPPSTPSTKRPNVLSPPGSLVTGALIGQKSASCGGAPTWTWLQLPTRSMNGGALAPRVLNRSVVSATSGGSAAASGAASGASAATAADADAAADAETDVEADADANAVAVAVCAAGAVGAGPGQPASATRASVRGLIR